MLAIATSVELGRTLVQALLSGLAMYGTVVVLVALALSVRLRKISKVSRGLVAIAVIVALLLYGMGKALAEVIS
ncbi:hypothetical protein E3E14_07115 [Streptomyces sp. ICN441]|uniref:hypothetical protein n=1 Tax=Streptomyces sp. ICN441 TaxID=2558286 RepID=UPI00106BAF5F|nr:hypothetical protein [Streptomyces sp. ICN441]TFE54693.1 hypothetical protein E3E14_07115 [Streptomyces sp. ICN441]